MTLTIPTEIEAKAKQQAFLEGVSVEDWLKHLVERELEKYASPRRSLQDEVSPEEWVRQFREWAQSHDRTTPLLSDEAISRESIYPDRI
ncbi:MAG: hypothetical protein ABSG65_24535 [Bryobacteraceae bacterium]|jgi:hypothetical protein